MNENTYNIIVPIIKDAAFFVGFALFFVSLLIGVLMLVRPALVEKFNRKASRGFSFRRATRFLEYPKNIDPLFYRHHRIIGAVITVLSAYVLYYFVAVYDSTLVAEYVRQSSRTVVYDILLTTLRIIMLFSGVFILLIGITIFIRPSALKWLEARANRWISTRRATRPLAMERQQVNQLAFKYPRITGLIIVLLSAYASILLYMVYTR